MAHITIDIARCKGCTLCVNYCPKKIIAMTKKFNPKGYAYPEVTDMDPCTGCMLCGQFCPDVCIEVFR